MRDLRSVPSAFGREVDRGDNAMNAGTGRPCTICTHPKRAEIDKALLDGVALRKIASAYGTTPQSVIRHRDAHLKRLLQAAAAEEQRQEAALGSDLLDQAKHLQKAALGFMTQAYRAGDLRTALAGVREATRLLELQGKLMGEIAPQT